MSTPENAAENADRQSPPFARPTAPEADSSHSSAAPAFAKQDPESLALRARPPVASRFKPEVIIAIAGVGGLVIAGIAWFALRDANLHLAGHPDDGAQTLKGAPDVLAGLPQSYDGVPKLGPPLPGDLGLPILQKQREGFQALEPTETIAKPVQAGINGPAEEERRAARTSDLFFSAAQVSSRSPVDPSGNAEASALAGEPEVTGSKMAINFTADPNAQQRKADFVAGANSNNDVEPHAMVQAASATMLSAGSVIPASLITGLRSDLPGMVIAQVTQQVFDSATGHILLIPQGARLIGSYDSLVAFGQKRALIVWQRIVMPDGSSVRLDNVPASDVSGYSGLEDQVDAHTWQIVKGAAISTLLGVGSDLTLTGESDLVQAIRQSTQQSVSRAGDQLVSRSLQIQPTITIRPGADVRLVVHRDLILPPWRPQESR